MRYSQLFKIMDEIGLSPEQLSAYFGVSGMTIRRWKKCSQNTELPKLYEKAVIDGIHSLIHEGKLSPDSKTIQSLLRRESLFSFEHVMGKMGLTLDSLASAESGQGSRNQEHGIISSLAQMGSDIHKVDAVEKSKKKILSFKNFSAEWAHRILTLLKVIQSKKMSGVEKLVAYGALFYLINPFDLIPDHLPVFGFVDDFAIIGLATAYYLKRFSHLL